MGTASMSIMTKSVFELQIEKGDGPLALNSDESIHKVDSGCLVSIPFR